MMSHDPFQNYQTPGAYPGAVTFGIPYTAFQSPFNPIALTGQPLQHAGIGGYGFYTPQQHSAVNPGQQNPLQQLLAWNQLATLQNPLMQNPLLQNPLLQNQLLQNQLMQNPLLQNPLVTASLQNPMLNPALAYQGWPQQQQQFGYPIAPQTMIGAGGIGQPFPQINPLAQLAFRQATGYGFNPVAGSF